jgi:hypothetical protein
MRLLHSSSYCYAKSDSARPVRQYLSSAVARLIRPLLRLLWFLWHGLVTGLANEYSGTGSRTWISWATACERLQLAYLRAIAGRGL